MTIRFALRLGYGTLTQLASAAASVTPAGTSKVRRALRARRGIAERYGGWGATGRDPSRPLLWMHAPSVGEGLMARPVLEAMRDRHPDMQLAFTHFSPSAAAFAESLDVDFRDYLAFDTAHGARMALDALRPSALVFSKLDVWPTLVREAHRRGVRLGMISATLAAGSSRRSAVVRTLLAEAYAQLDAVGAVDAADAERLVNLGVRPERIEVTGDTRYDQVWRRVQRLDRSTPMLAGLASDRPTLVAGSTWPADEAVLLPAFVALRRAVPTARLIIAPHELSDAHIEPVVAWAASVKLVARRLDDPGAGNADVVIVTRMGVLADLYALATVAYVGGGFHAAGLHSVLEPAAFGAPVLVGPRIAGSRDATLLLNRQGGRAVATPGEFAATAGEWISNARVRNEVGGRARALVRSGLGAADRSVALVDRLVSG